MKRPGSLPINVVPLKSRDLPPREPAWFEGRLADVCCWCVAVALLVAMAFLWSVIELQGLKW